MLFRYQPNKEADLLAEPYSILKKHFCLSQDKVWTLSNKRPSKLRDNLTELEVWHPETNNV